MIRAGWSLVAWSISLALASMRCGGRVEQAPSDTPSGAELAAPPETRTEPCELCVDPKATYCSDLDCRQGQYFCDLYGCFACTRCANPEALCAHARCLP